MYRSRISWLLFAVRWMVLSVHGQLSGWLPNQANATMCNWYDFRVATLKDTVYIDGGHLYWVAGMADGSYNPAEPDFNFLGRIYTLNFSTPFNRNTNFSAILTNSTLAKGYDGGAPNNIAPNYYSGALLANDHEFHLYGGTLDQTDTDTPPDADAVLGYLASQYGPERESFRPGFRNEQLPSGMTRYVAYGGTANAPSENKAWYFGGYRSESWGPIYEKSGNTTFIPSNVSDHLITLDMTTQQGEVWSNTTLPPGTPSRGGSSVVWVPVGEQGILVVLGGVTYPDYLNGNDTSANPAQSQNDSPSFFRNIDVYDIAGKQWYQQPSDGSGPAGALTMGCAVVAPAQDYSSFNIYYYGGYNGVDSAAEFNDNVYILTLPSFQWMPVYSGSSEHGRAGHQCVMPYPDQMITIGGRRPDTSGSPACLPGDPAGMLEVYNLTSNVWMDSYDPKSWNHYGVPEMIQAMIGGDFSGGATATTPKPSGWATAGLGEVFATPYATTKLTTYYPYSSVGPGNDTRGVYEGESGGGGGTPSWLAPVLGVVLGLVFVTAVIVGILLYRRRRLLKKNGGTQHSTDENGNRTMAWVRGQSDAKAPTITTEDTRTQYDEMESHGITPMRSPAQPDMRSVPEMPGEALAELMGDTSPIVELLGDTQGGNTGGADAYKQSPLASNLHTFYSPTSPSDQSLFTPSHELSSDSSQQPSSFAQRPDSPALGNNNNNGNHNTHFNSIASAITTDTPTAAPAAPAPPPTNRRNVVSGLSGISDRDTAHLRQISDASTATQDTGLAPPPPPTTGAGAAAAPPSSSGSPPPLVSPPSVDGAPEPPDYVSASRGAAGPGSPLRRSFFHEHEDDLGGREGGGEVK